MVGRSRRDVRRPAHREQLRSRRVSRRSLSNHTLTTIVTFYAAYDNDPPGTTTIAFPNARRAHAGGTGTADDPLTLPSVPAAVAVGTRIYCPRCADTSAWRISARRASSVGGRRARRTSTS